MAQKSRDLKYAQYQKMPKEQTDVFNTNSEVIWLRSCFILIRKDEYRTGWKQSSRFVALASDYMKLFFNSS